MAKKIRRSAPTPQGSSPADKRAAPAASGGPRRRRKRVKGQLVTDFTIQLSTLVEAGIPVVKALKILEGQAPSGPFKVVLSELVEAVSGGAPLSESMAKHEGVFDDLYSNMVRAGEAGGVLDQILERLATFREKAAEIEANIRSTRAGSPQTTRTEGWAKVILI